MTSTTDDSLKHERIFDLVKPLWRHEEQLKEELEEPRTTKEPLAPSEPPPLGPEPTITIANMATNPVEKAKEMNIGRPKAFSGDRTKVSQFLQQCKLYLVMNKDTYENDDKKIGFVLSLIWRSRRLEQTVHRVMPDRTSQIGDEHHL